jgi:arylsulfatase A-like enzyme
VHTYRTHLPYTVSDATRAELGDRLDLADPWPALEARMEELTRAAAGPGAGILDEVRRVTAKIEAHYRATARDLARGVAELLADFERRGLGDDAWLVFTSDHGEAFYEHDAIYHACKVWEEVVRVPLFLRGPGVVPGRVDVPVSLIDLAPTVSDMAGLAPHPAWVGRSLLRPEIEPRPLFMFECEPARPSTLGIVDGARKVIGFEEAEALRAGRLFGAFDLAADPGERTDLARDGAAAWPAEVLGRNAERALELLTPRVAGQRAAVGATRVQELRDVGYAGDDDQR